MSNCIAFAIALYWRRWLATRRIWVEGERYVIIARGGPRMLLARESRLGSLIPHVLFAEVRHGRVKIFHYVPVNPVPRLLPPPLFHGWIKRGDWQDTVAEDQ
jgi:hypothetical protein